MSTPFNKVVACNVRFLRQEKGMTIEELAQRAFMALGTASNIENANRKRDVDRNYIVQIAKALDVTLDVLTEENREISVHFKEVEQFFANKQFEGDVVKLVDELLVMTSTRGAQERARALLNKGKLEYFRGQITSSIEFYSSSLKVAYHTSNSELLHTVRYNLASSYILAGDYGQALYLISEDNEGNEDPEQRASNHYLLGLIHANQHLMLKSEQSFIQALNELDEHDERYSSLIGRVHQALGEVYKTLRNYDKSLEHSNKALSMTKMLKDLIGEVYAQITIGEVLIEQGKFEIAQQVFSQALICAQRIGSFRQHECYKVQFFIAFCSQEYHEMKRLLNCLEELDIEPRDVAILYKRTAQVAVNLQLHVEAQIYYEKALNKFDI